MSALYGAVANMGGKDEKAAAEELQLHILKLSAMIYLKTILFDGR